MQNNTLTKKVQTMMDLKILDFIGQNHLLSLSTIDDDGVYVANCYYAFDTENLTFLIKSDKTSKHIQLAQKNPKIGITIAKDHQNLSLLKGLQIKALFKDASLMQKEIYYSHFPYAKLIKGDIFALEIQWAKYTDNKLLLNQKLFYQKISSS